MCFSHDLQRHLRLAVLLTGDRLHAEELLQDCLVKMYERWRKLAHDHADLHAYLRRALTNGYISVWRRYQRQTPVAEPPDRAAAAVQPHPEAEELRRALLTLPRRQRVVVVLRHYEDLAEQIAGLLGCSVGTVEGHARRQGKSDAPGGREAG